MMESSGFFTRLDEVQARQAFDDTISITTGNFDRLIGPYVFSEHAVCQVAKVSGRCGHPHRNGWLGRTQDGREGLIGGHCAKRHFKGDERFLAEKRRLDFENDLARLHEYVADRGGLIARAQCILSTLRDIRAAVRELEQKLPSNVVSFLKERAKTGNGQVAVEVRYVEVDENGRQHSTWQWQTVGNLLGMAIWQQGNLAAISDKAKDIEAAASQAEPLHSAGDRKVRSWLKVLDELPAVEHQVLELQRHFETFTSFENLCLLIFLPRDENKQVEVTEVAFTAGQGAPDIRRDARALRNQCYRQISTDHNGRDFRGAL